MKITKLTISNIGLIKNETIEINKPLLLFYGSVMAGKSTILNAVRWCLGGTWPEDIISHGEAEGRVKLEFEGGSVERSWYRGKGGTKARDIVFVRNGSIVSKPATEIARLLNPFQTDPDFLRKKSEPERKAFFAELFAVHTSHLDSEAAACASQASSLRSEIKGYGEIDPIVNIPPGEPPSVASLQAEMEFHADRHHQAMMEWNKENAAAAKREAEIRGHQSIEKQIANRIIELREELDRQEKAAHACLRWFSDNPPITVPPAPSEPDELSLIRAKISDAAASVERCKAWQKEKARLDRKEQAEKDLAECEKRQREIKEEKAKLLKTSADTCGVPGLAFDDTGSIIYEGTTAGMLSTSQLMRLSSALAALYPPGLAFDLVDRAESLGASIYDFIDRAKAKELTILATVVGEAPAKSPPEVGVFVVEKGKVTTKKNG